MSSLEDIAIKVQGVSKTFLLPHEKRGSLKGVLLNVFRRKSSFERQKVLNDINLDIKKGEFFGIVGKNGSGKSTLLKLLAGIYTPDSGAVVVDGKIIAFIELGVGFNPELTGRENVYLSGALLGFSGKEVDAMYDDIVRFAELERFMDQKLRNYSSGMQVRLAFSIAIRVKGDILILDEVLAVGDAAFQQKCYNHFEELKRRGQTVVFVSHDMGAVARFCTRAAYIEAGKIVKEGLPSDISDLYTEANISKDDQDPVEKKQEKPKNSKYSIRLSDVKQSKDSTVFTFKYKSPKNVPMVIGLSFIRDGAVIAEVCTDKSMRIAGSGSVTYALDTSIFNSGIFSIAGISFFTAADKELMAVANQTKEFAVKGFHKNRAGTVKLTESWKHAKH